MSKKEFGFVGIGIFGTVLLCTTLMVSVITSNNSQAESIALKDGAMAQITGGVKYTKGNMIQPKDKKGKFAPCRYPKSCPTEQFTYKPEIHSCFTCNSPSKTRYYKAEIFKKYVSWCDNTIDTECPYEVMPYNKRDDCTTSLNTSC